MLAKKTARNLVAAAVAGAGIFWAGAHMREAAARADGPGMTQQQGQPQGQIQISPFEAIDGAPAVAYEAGRSRTLNLEVLVQNVDHIDVLPARKVTSKQTLYFIEIYVPGLSASAMLTDDEAKGFADALDKAMAAQLSPGLSRADVRGTVDNIYYEQQVGEKAVTLRFLGSAGPFGRASSAELKQALLAAVDQLGALRDAGPSVKW